MAVTIAPSVEAMDAITDRINSGTAYVLDVTATYGELMIDEREEIDCLRVDVTSEDEVQLSETLDTEDRTSHAIRVWIRSPIRDTRENDKLAALKLLTRQIFQRLNTGSLNNTRVQIWDVDEESKQNPDKALLHQDRLYVASIVLRVEVEAA